MCGGGDGGHEEVRQPAQAQRAEDGAGAHLPRLPEVAQRAYDAAVLPHLLQQMRHYAGYEWSQLRHLQTSLSPSRFKARFSN